MELKRAVLSRRNTAKLCGMKLYLRRATHSQAHDNYRVILKREEGEFEIRSIGILARGRMHLGN